MDATSSRPLLAVLVLVPLLSPSVFADENIDERLAVDPAGSVLVRCVRGDVSIEGWDRPEARVVGELDDLARDLIFERSGNETRIILELKRDGGIWGDGADLEIYLPRASALRVDAVSADVEIEGMVGSVAVRTVSGDVEAEALGERTRVQTTSGDIEVQGAEGQLQIMTTSGDVRLDVAAREVSVDSVSGDADVELEGFDSARLSTVNGDVELEGTLNAGGSLTGNSTSGNLEIRLAKPVHATAELRAGPGGNITNRLNNAKPAREPAGYVLRLELGDGSGRIRLDTVNGNVRLEGE